MYIVSSVKCGFALQNHLLDTRVCLTLNDRESRVPKTFAGTCILSDVNSKMLHDLFGGPSYRHKTIQTIPPLQSRCLAYSS